MMVVGTDEKRLAKVFLMRNKKNMNTFGLKKKHLIKSYG